MTNMTRDCYGVNFLQLPQSSSIFQPISFDIYSWLKTAFKRSFLGRNLADNLTAVQLLRKSRARFFGDFDGKMWTNIIPKQGSLYMTSTQTKRSICQGNPSLPKNFASSLIPPKMGGI